MLETIELRKVFKGKTAVEEVSLYLEKGNPWGCSDQMELGSLQRFR